MKCPECGAPCYREEVDIGVGTYCSEYWCSECEWEESKGFPMEDYNWEEFLEADDYLLT
jgi:hypothetical protein